MSVKLTDAQLVMMSAAAQREDRCLTAPETMRDAAVSKVSAKLVKLGLVREIRAKAGTPVWRRDNTGQGYALKLTAAGLKAIVVGEGSEEAIESIDTTQARALPEDVGEHAKTRAPRDSSKLARVNHPNSSPENFTVPSNFTRMRVSSMSGRTERYGDYGNAIPSRERRLRSTRLARIKASIRTYSLE